MAYVINALNSARPTILKKPVQISELKAAVRQVTVGMGAVGVRYKAKLRNETLKRRQIILAVVPNDSKHLSVTAQTLFFSERASKNGRF